MKADDLRSLERTERMMVRWMCGVSLKDRKRSEDLCNLLGINCVADVVRRGRLRWFGHLERKSVDDWVSACRGLVVEGTRGRGRSRKTWEQCVRDDMKLLGLHPEWAVFRDMWRDLIWGKRLTLAWRGKMDVLKINDDDDDDDDLISSWFLLINLVIIVSPDLQLPPQPRYHCLTWSAAASSTSLSLSHLISSCFLINLVFFIVLLLVITHVALAATKTEMW